MEKASGHHIVCGTQLPQSSQRGSLWKTRRCGWVTGEYRKGIPGGEFPFAGQSSMYCHWQCGVVFLTALKANMDRDAVQVRELQR